MEGALTIAELIQVPMAAAFEAVVADQTQIDMTLSMTMDMTQLVALTAAMDPENAPDEESMAQIQALAQDGIKVLYRGDLSTGKLYMTFEGAILEAAGIPANTWFLIDMNTLLESMELDYTQLMEETQEAAAEDWTDLVLNELDLNDALSLSGVCYMLETLVSAVADDAFVTEGNTRTLTIPYADETSQLELTLVLTMEGDKVAGAGLALDLAAYVAESDSVMQMAVALAMDKAGKCSGRLVVDDGAGTGIDLSIGAESTQSTEAPQTEPPAGALVIDLFGENGEVPDAAEILNGMMGIMPLGE